jgi:hypothetical protein
MNGICPRCKANILPAYTCCPYCGERLTLPKLYSGKTAPMLVATQRMPAAGRPLPPHTYVPQTAAHPTASGGQGYVTTGVATREAEVVATDRSGSMDEPGQRGTKMDDLKAAERTHVLQKMHIDQQDRVALVSFESDATIDCDWAVLQDPSPLLAAIDSLTPGGGTCFEAGLRKAEELFGRCPCGSGSPVLFKVLLFTDGHNNEGAPAPVAERLRNMGVIIQAIGFGASEQDVDVQTLRSIVSVVDGQEQYWFCSNAQQLTRTFKALSGKTRVLPR